MASGALEAVLQAHGPSELLTLYFSLPSDAEVAAEKLASIPKDILVVPRTLGGYVIEECIGVGAYGRCYRVVARDGSQHALKVSAKGLAYGAEKEAIILTAIQPGPASIIALVGYFEVCDLACLVLELGDGGSLESCFEKVGAVKDREACARSVVKGVAEALAHMHFLGYVYRDLKPANIVYCKGQPKLIDFGTVARVGPRGIPLISSEGEAVIEGPFTAPEVLQDDKADLRAAEVYALGQLWFALVQVDIYDPEDPKATATLRKLDPLLQRMLSLRPANRPVMSEIAFSLL